jgi:anti-sigma B factor antagonist
MAERRFMLPQAAVRHAGPVAIVDLEGRITVGEGCAVVRNAVRDLVNAGSRNILLNLQGVSYVDSSGLGEMAGSYVTVAKLGGQLKLLHSHSRVDTMLQVTKLYALLVTFGDEQEALRSFQVS